MTIRSIFEIDVDPEGKWKAFQAEFQKHQEAVKQLPRDWQSVADKRSQLAKISGSARVDHLGRTTDFFGTPLAGENAKKFREASEGAHRAMHGVALETKDVAGNIAKATKELLKWGGIVSAFGALVGVGGGLFGIDRLAMSAGGARRGAQGLGISSGEQKSFEINFGRLVDTDSLLSNVAAAKSDWSKKHAFSSLKINDFESRDAADVAVDVIKRAKALWGSTDKSEQSLHSYGLDQFMLMDTWRRIGGTSAKDLAGFIGQYVKNKTTLGLSDADLKRWQDLNRQLAEAGAVIEKVLIQGLEPLADPLKELSKSAGDLAQALMPKLQDWTRQAAEGLEVFAKYVGSDDFNRKINEFITGIGQMADGVEEWLKRFGIVSRGKGEAVPLSPVAGPEAFKRQEKIWEGLEHPKIGQNLQPPANSPGIDFGAIAAMSFSGANLGVKRRETMKFFESKGWSHDQAAGIVANIERESGLNSSAIGDHGAAIGLGQWHRDRQKHFQQLFGHTIGQSDEAEQLEFYNWELSHTEADAGRRLHMAKDAREAAGIVSTYDERPADKQGEAQRRGDLAVQLVKQQPVQITVQNQTGGSAVISSSQLVQ